ncbi:MAG: SixA phosphatase family protein [Micropepsaceae bacterium]
MKTVYILRHAKSDQSDGSISDHDRPLNARGRETAPRMGAYLKTKGYKPDLVLCSTARRTVETCELVRPSLGDITVTFEAGLYLAEARTISDRLRKLDDALGSAMVIGHNPGLEELAGELSASPKTPDEERLHRRMREKFATATLAVITFPMKRWREIKAGGGALADFMRPRDL